MKKLVLTTVCALAVTGAAFAQGTLTWSSFSSSTAYQTNSTVYSPYFGGGTTGSGAVGNTSGGTGTGNYYYELLYLGGFTGSQVSVPGTLSGLLSWSDTLLSATNVVAPSGRIAPIAGNNAAAPANGTWGAGGIGVGVTNSIILVGWSANLGTTWFAVSNVLANWATLSGTIVGNAYFGVSATGYLVGNTGNPGATVFGPSASGNGLPINTLAGQLDLLPVPEPATLALAGLGGLSLMLFRRQRKS